MVVMSGVHLGTDKKLHDAFTPTDIFHRRTWRSAGPPWGTAVAWQATDTAVSGLLYGVFWGRQGDLHYRASASSWSM